MRRDNQLRRELEAEGFQHRRKTRHGDYYTHPSAPGKLLLVAGTSGGGRGARNCLAKARQLLR